jgi:tRNA A-37 threonylcarbamoyl transferase component Bud32
MEPDSFAPGEVVYALNPKYRDGTRLRAEPRPDADFNGVWVPNDSSVEVVQRAEEWYEVKKPDGQKGWILARNLTRAARVPGYYKGATSQLGTTAANPTGGAPTLAGGPQPLSLEALPAELREHPRYRVVRLIGHGGMGAVYEAEHLVMGRRVALKVIHPRFIASPDAVERFQREVRSASRLHHPNVVTAHDAEQAGDVHFLVMEYVEGKTLTQHLRETGPLSAPEACSIARQAALGLQHADEKGLTHRDVKPDNLMLTPDGTVKVLDFGLARLGPEAEAVADGATPAPEGGRLTAVGTVMGTPDYLAPEQATDAQNADTRADLYSLGCTLYRMLTGQVPFPGGGTLDKLLAHAQQKPAPLSKFRSDLPRGLEEVVVKLMAKRPEDRYQTPAEAAAALAPFAAPPKSQRRWRWLAIAAMASIAWALVVASCVVLSFRVRPVRPGVSGEPEAVANGVEDAHLIIDGKVL